MEHGGAVEELVGYLGDEKLTDDNDCNDRPEARTHSDAEHRFACLETTGVEHIPEVSPHEYGKQQRDGARNRIFRGVKHLNDRSDIHGVEDAVKPECDGEEEEADPDKFRCHGTGEDESFAVARWIIHNFGRGGKRGESHGAECVHYQVHPKHLCHRQWRFRTDKRPYEH